jgi:hypothetical protein
MVTSVVRELPSQIDGLGVKVGRECGRFVAHCQQSRPQAQGDKDATQMKGDYVPVGILS